MRISHCFRVGKIRYLTLTILNIKAMPNNKSLKFFIEICNPETGEKCEVRNDNGKSITLPVFNFYISFPTYKNNFFSFPHV